METVADLEKLLGGAYSLHLLPIIIPFKLQWLQIHREGLRRDSIHLARVGGAPGRTGRERVKWGFHFRAYGGARWDGEGSRRAAIAAV